MSEHEQKPIATPNYRQPNKHRIAAAFRHERPDRVPNFEVLVSNPTLAHVMGREIRGGHTLANIDPADYIEFANRTGQDVVGMCFYDDPFFYRDEQGQARRLDFPIRSRADLDRVFVGGLERLAPSFDLLDRYVEAIEGADVGLFVLLGSFFTAAYDSIFGFENFLAIVETAQTYGIH